MEHNWSMEMEVVIIGYGGAGAAAAITAHDSGAEVIILEKMLSGGGNTRLCGGGLFCPTGQKAIDHVEALCFGKTNREVVQAYVEGCMTNNDWLREMGGKIEVHGANMLVMYPPMAFPSWPNVPGAEETGDICFCRVAEEPDAGEPAEGFNQWKGAEPLWRLLERNVERRGVRVMTNTPARELITNENGEVVGVLAERNGERISIKAKRGTILACGGFDNNDAMKDTFLPLTPLLSVGNPGNTGDGIVMAEKVGAALWHMYQFYGWFVFVPPKQTDTFDVRFFGPSFIYVDKDGRRFADEVGSEAHEQWKTLMHFLPHRSNFPHLPIYAIFDESLRRKGPVAAGMGLTSRKDYQWSMDNSQEIGNGWIKRGKTIGELARQISVDEAILADTVAKYNEYCKVGRDDDYVRSKEILWPIDTAPYYAIELWPAVLATSGGPRRDKEGRVLNHENKPIPRLYSAGALGSLWGFSTLAGSSITEGMVFGRIAGRNAAAEKPW